LPLLILAVLIGIPVVEIYTFVEVGDEIGALNTVLLTILTAIAGMALLRYQGLSVLMQAQERINAGQSPVNEILNGVLLALAGLFLLIPGFVTDTVGFLLFMPPLRNFLAARMSTLGRFSAHGHNYHGGGRYQGQSTVIDGEYTIVTEEEPANSKEEQDRIENRDEDNPWGKNT